MAIDTSVADPKITSKPGDVIVRIDELYYRPVEVESPLSDPSKAKDSRGWQPTTTLDEMISEMMENDLQSARKNRLLINEGYEVSQPVE